MNDVCNTSAIKIPNQRGSKPRVNSAGPIRGITINVISMKSKMKPSKNIMKRTIIRVSILSLGNSTNNL